MQVDSVIFFVLGKHSIVIFYKTNHLCFSLFNRTFKKSVCSVFICKEFVWKSGQVCSVLLALQCFLYIVFNLLFIRFLILNGMFYLLNCCFLLHRREKITSLFFIVFITTFDWNTTLKIMYELSLTKERLNHQCKVQFDMVHVRYYSGNLAFFIRTDVFLLLLLKRTCMLRSIQS